MAVANSYPPMHAPHHQPTQIPQLRPSYQTEPFDPAVLCRKLEVAKRERSAAWQRYKQQAAASPNGIYVPRMAAQQFASTTTSAKDMSITFRKQAGQPPRLRQPLASVEKSAAQPLDAKHVFALKELGMSSTEALLQVHGQKFDGRRHTSSGLSKPAKLVDDSQDLQPAAATYKPGDAARRRNSNNAQASRPVLAPPSAANKQEDSKVKRSTSGGDRTDKRGKHASNYIAIKHGSQTTYEPRPETAAARKSVFLEDEEEDEEHPTRPRLRHDRPDWAQQSTCGDEARDLFHLLHIHKRHSDSEPTAQPTQQQQQQLRRGSAPMRDNLINDAVKIIKKEEKDLRKQRISGFFKRGGDKTSPGAPAATVAAQ